MDKTEGVGTKKGDLESAPNAGGPGRSETKGGKRNRVENVKETEKWKNAKKKRNSVKRKNIFGNVILPKVLKKEPNIDAMKRNV